MSRLLPEELKEALPKLRAQDGSKDPIVYATFYFPASNWIWYVTEGEPEGDDFIFFGYVIGFESEWGYFGLREMEGVEICGVRVQRAENFKPQRFSEIPPF